MAELSHVLEVHLIQPLAAIVSSFVIIPTRPWYLANDWSSDADMAVCRGQIFVLHSKGLWTSGGPFRPRLSAECMEELQYPQIEIDSSQDLMWMLRNGKTFVARLDGSLCVHWSKLDSDGDDGGDGYVLVPHSARNGLVGLEYWDGVHEANISDNDQCDRVYTFNLNHSYQDGLICMYDARRGRYLNVFFESVWTKIVFRWSDSLSKTVVLPDKIVSTLRSVIWRGTMMSCLDRSKFYILLEGTLVVLHTGSCDSDHATLISSSDRGIDANLRLAIADDDGRLFAALTADSRLGFFAVDKNIS